MGIKLETTIFIVFTTAIGISNPLKIFPDGSILNQIISAIIYDLVAIVGA